MQAINGRCEFEGLSSYDQMASSEADMTHGAWPRTGMSGTCRKEVKHKTSALFYITTHYKVVNPTCSPAVTFLTQLVCMQMIS